MKKIFTLLTGNTNLVGVEADIRSRSFMSF